MTDKNLLIARMAANRSRLLRELIGVSEDALMKIPVYGDWTAANMLAHLGEYDDLFARSIPLALSGEIGTAGVDFTDIRDHLLHERVGNWSLEGSVEYMMAARSRFLKALADVSPADMDRQRRYPWKFGGKTGTIRSTIRAWTRARFLHDDGHHEDLREWRRKLKREPEAGPRVILQAALEAAHMDFAASADLVAESERDTRLVCGHWTLKDVLGHLADGDSYYLHTIHVMLDEPGDPFWSTNPVDDDALNEEMAKKRRKYSYRRQLSDCESSRRELIVRLERLSDEELSFPYSGHASSYPTIYHCYWSALEHYLDHAAVLRRELGVKFPKYLLRFKGPYADRNGLL